MFGFKLNKYMTNFHPLEVVGRGSETQHKYVYIIMVILRSQNKITDFVKILAEASPFNLI